LVGSSRKRHEVMLIGTIAGLSAGVAVSKLLARWTTTDVSVILRLCRDDHRLERGVVDRTPGCSRPELSTASDPPLAARRGLPDAQPPIFSTLVASNTWRQG
jgi:hypothetical protein